MDSSIRHLKLQQILLVAVRILCGWHFLYEGLYKLMHPEWSSLGFLASTQWIFSGIAQWITTNPGVLNAVDVLNTWGLIIIGLGLVLGMCTRLVSVAGFLLLLLYYIFNPPFIGLSSLAEEGNYLLVNKNLIEALVLLYLAANPNATRWGLDMLRKKYRIKPPQ